jgi:outer membrane lipoprotein-sorting protein
VSWWLAVTAACLLAAEQQPSTPTDANPAATAQPSRFETRLAALDKRIAKVEGLVANFEQKRSTPLLKKPIVSRGTVKAKGGRLRWDTLEPEPSTMLMDGREVRVYYPGAKVVEVYPIGSRTQEASGSPLPRLRMLHERFEITEIDVSEMGVGAGGEGGRFFALELKPKSEELRKYVERVRVLLDEERTIASRIDITDADGEVTEMRFSDIRTGDIVKDEDLRLVVPAGTRESRPAEGARVNWPSEGGTR